MGSVGNTSIINAGSISGNVSFEQIVKASNNSISFDRTVTVLPDRMMPISGRKQDLGDLINKANINDVVINMYRDRSGANDLKRMQDLGFKIIAQYKGQDTNSTIPPRDYYYMKKD